MSGGANKLDTFIHKLSKAEWNSATQGDIEVLVLKLNNCKSPLSLRASFDALLSLQSQYIQSGNKRMSEFIKIIILAISDVELKRSPEDSTREMVLDKIRNSFQGTSRTRPLSEDAASSRFDVRQLCSLVDKLQYTSLGLRSFELPIRVDGVLSAAHKCRYKGGLDHITQHTTTVVEMWNSENLSIPMIVSEFLSNYLSPIEVHEHFGVRFRDHSPRIISLQDHPASQRYQGNDPVHFFTRSMNEPAISHLQQNAIADALLLIKPIKTLQFQGQTAVSNFGRPASVDELYNRMESMIALFLHEHFTSLNEILAAEKSVLRLEEEFFIWPEDGFIGVLIPLFSYSSCIAVATYDTTAYSKGTVLLSPYEWHPSNILFLLKTDLKKPALWRKQFT